MTKTTTTKPQPQPNSSTQHGQKIIQHKKGQTQEREYVPKQPSGTTAK